MAKYKPIATYSYARRLKSVKPGKVQHFKLKGKRVKAYVDPSGRTLDILEAPKSLLPDRDLFKLVPQDGVLRIVPVEKTKPEPEPAEQPKPEPAQPQPQTQEEETSKEEAKEEEMNAKQPQPSPPPSPSTSPIERPRLLTEAERKKAMLVPVPDSGPIPTPYIDWDAIPPHCRVSGIVYHDYPIRGASRGLLPELKELFALSRRYQDKAPINTLIWGPKGTGKSQVIRRFAEETGLPYWSVIGRPGITADELLGHWEIKSDKEGGGTRWVEGIIPRAVRAGGILHIDEANVIEGEILTRLDELMDDKRQLNLHDLNGEIIKAHPDLFVVFTMNPPIYEGLKPLPEHIQSRLTKTYWLDYPPAHVEMQILEKKLRSFGVKSSEFKAPEREGEEPKGTMARDITDFMKVIQGLRRETELTYTPSLRETQGFVQDLREGKSFFEAFDRNVGNKYYEPDHQRMVEEALFGTGRTR